MHSHLREKALALDTSVRIAGQTVAGRAEYPVYDCSTGSVHCMVSQPSSDDIDEMVRSASAAQRDWAMLPVDERVSRFRSFLDHVETRADELALLDSISCGNPLRYMITDVHAAAKAARFFCDNALELGGRTTPLDSDGFFFTERAPFGVVLRIVPFNHPAMFAIAKIAAAIVAGNSVILKPSEQSPLSALLIAEIANELLPAGLLQVAPGAGPDVGRLLVSHPEIRRIGFIGSTMVGRAIQQDAAQSGVKSVSLELGGKNALIIDRDVEAAVAAECLVRGMNFGWCAGQSCGSTSRVFVHSDIFRDVTEIAAAKVDALVLGDALDDSSDMGPLVSRSQVARVKKFASLALGQGAMRATSRTAPNVSADISDGFFVEPLMLTSVDRSMDIFHDEVFGPIAAVLEWSDESSLIDHVNDSKYGLTAGILSNDFGRVLRLTRTIEAGYVWVNDVSRHYTGLPFGGWKDSGIGVEESAEELWSYSQYKSVVFRPTFS